MRNVSDFFGCKVMDDRVIKANLSAKKYWPFLIYGDVRLGVK